MGWYSIFSMLTVADVGSPVHEWLHMGVFVLLMALPLSSWWLSAASVHPANCGGLVGLAVAQTTNSGLPEQYNTQ